LTVTIQDISAQGGVQYEFKCKIIIKSLISSCTLLSAVINTPGMQWRVS